MVINMQVLLQYSGTLQNTKCGLNYSAPRPIKTAATRGGWLPLQDQPPPPPPPPPLPACPKTHRHHASPVPLPAPSCGRPTTSRRFASGASSNVSLMHREKTDELRPGIVGTPGSMHGHTTKAMHDNDYTPTSPPLSPPRHIPSTIV